MMRVLAGLAFFGLVIGGLVIGHADTPMAQSPKGPPSQRPGTASPTVPPTPAAPQSPASREHTGELDCRNCHQRTHQGVVRMYLGIGGRGTPAIPSHMLQVRVECIACHVASKAEEGGDGIVGRTFRPSEQACLDCHGEKYRGMLEGWAKTLRRMSGILAPKVRAARTALSSADPKNAKHGRARELVNDADYNTGFVALAKGVHNVFYAADLLKLANGWLDEAMGLLGKPPLKVDDTLVRGGYCAVLCHEQAGLKVPQTVTFGKQRVPHTRHVTEFGAVCTACHSAEVHKAVTAQPATCTACHHSPANERCESCHRAQSAFYRGDVKTPLVKVEPNVMIAAVGCTGCHDLSQKHSREAVGQKCVSCHDAAYMSFMTEWTTGLEEQTARTSEVVKRAEAALARQRRGGRPSAEADALVKEARDALALVRRARGVHNPGASESLLQVARQKAEDALARVGSR